MLSGLKIEKRKKPIKKQTSKQIGKAIERKGRKKEKLLINTLLVSNREYCLHWWNNKHWIWRLLVIDCFKGIEEEEILS